MKRNISFFILIKKHYVRAGDYRTHLVANLFLKYDDTDSRHIEKLVENFKSQVKAHSFDPKVHISINGFWQRSNFFVTQTTSTKGQPCGFYPNTLRTYSQMRWKAACVWKTAYHHLSHPSATKRQVIVNYYALILRCWKIYEKKTQMIERSWKMMQLFYVTKNHSAWSHNNTRTVWWLNLARMPMQTMKLSSTTCSSKMSTHRSATAYTTTWQRTQKQI